LRGKWPMIAAAGIGAGITLWSLSPDPEKNEREVKTNITRSTARISKAINFYDKASSQKRNKVLEKNEKTRSQVTKAEVVGETIANYEILKKSVDNLTETIKKVQELKAMQRQTSGKEPVEDISDLRQWGEEPELKIGEINVVSDSETDADEEKEEDGNTLGQLGNVATILGTGLQRMSGIAQGLFFGSQRRISVTAIDRERTS